MFPALAGGFLTPAPPGKSQKFLVLMSPFYLFFPFVVCALGIIITIAKSEVTKV